MRFWIWFLMVTSFFFLELDEELFEDEPMEYIKRDLEGNDNATRRRAASELVRGLLEQFPAEVTAIIGSYIQSYLQRYSTNVAQNWKDKDAALYLLTSIAARSVGSQVCHSFDHVPLRIAKTRYWTWKGENGPNHSCLVFILVWRSRDKCTGWYSRLFWQECASRLECSRLWSHSPYP